MTRTGGKNEPSFRLVATDSRNPRDGRYLEALGWYDPKKDGKNFDLKMDRVEFWKSRGAILSQAARNLLRRARRAGS
jgi:small subunit ribosomal protein S16